MKDLYEVLQPSAFGIFTSLIAINLVSWGSLLWRLIRTKRGDGQ